MGDSIQDSAKTALKLDEKQAQSQKQCPGNVCEMGVGSRSERPFHQSFRAGDKSHLATIQTHLSNNPSG